jgi:hypothetical protein
MHIRPPEDTAFRSGQLGIPHSKNRERLHTRQKFQLWSRN